MPELKDGKVVYSDAELAAAQQANESTDNARLAQVEADAESAQASALQKLAMQSAQIAQPNSGDA